MIKRDLVTSTQLKMMKEMMTDDYVERFKENMIHTNALVRDKVQGCVSKEEMGEEMKKKVDAVMLKK